MILGIGVDLIEKERFVGWVERPGARRRFAAEELAYAEKSGRAAEVLAAAFATKEAFYKAAVRLLPEEVMDAGGLLWRVSLCHRADGSPEAVPDEVLRIALREAGVRRIHLSITHDRTQVLALVILESDAAAEHDMRAMLPGNFSGFSDAGECRVLDSRVAAGLLPERVAESSKFDYGHVMVLGGSPGMGGAAQMAAEAALVGGAGLVTLAALSDAAPLSPEVMRRCIKPGDAVEAVGEFMADGRYRRRVLAVGMGLGRSAEVAEAVRAVAVLPLPKVIDADGLNALSLNTEQRNTEQNGVRPVQAVLTPHIGEMARLLGCTTAEIKADMAGAARRCAAEYNAVVVLKAHRTLVTSPGGVLWRNTTGNPGMACGGSGDVLAGLIAAWLAQGLDSLSAALLGVYLHGLAGDLAAAELTQYGMTAMSIVRYLPQAYRSLLGNR